LGIYFFESVISVLVLSIAIISLQIEGVWLWRAWGVRAEVVVEVLEKSGDDEVGVLALEPHAWPLWSCCTPCLPLLQEC
jgi:hypothetical protein